MLESCMKIYVLNIGQVFLFYISEEMKKIILIKWYLGLTYNIYYVHSVHLLGFKIKFFFL